MCKVLDLPIQSYYYKPTDKSAKAVNQLKLKSLILEIFQKNHYAFGALRIQHILRRSQVFLSTKTIRKFMNELNLISSYTKKKFKKPRYDNKVNNSKITNILDRNYSDQKQLSVVCSDLTYVSVNNKWNYICVILDLYNREVISYSISQFKDSQLVLDALNKLGDRSKKIELFHTDRGSEFNNYLVEDFLEGNKIQRSLSKKGNPYDNAVMESFYKILKTEFTKRFKFKSLEELDFELFQYINWYNRIRPHSKLNYLSPKEYHLEIST